MTFLLEGFLHVFFTASDSFFKIIALIINRNKIERKISVEKRNVKIKLRTAPGKPE